MFSFSKIAQSKESKAVVYAAAFGLLASDIIPTPADALYFYVEKNLRDNWKSGNITAQKYWTFSTAAYYSFNPIWWGAVLAVVMLTRGSVTQKAKVGLGIIGVGAVVGVIYHNIRQDIKANSP